jgi:HEAT repeat protein
MIPEQSQKPTHVLIEELVAALHLRPWIDEPEDRYELKKEIIKRVRSGESSLTLVLRLLNHADWGVREDAIEMLGWIGNVDATQPLLEIMWKDRSKAVRGSAALALERIGGPEALAAYQEYSATIRSYPEVVGEVAKLAKRKGITTNEFFNAALRNQTHGICVEDTDEDGALSFDLCHIMAIIGRPSVPI